MVDASLTDHLDLGSLPDHLHEWARNLEAEANRRQRQAEDLECMLGCWLGNFQSIQY
jgi:hypothetical protein